MKQASYTKKGPGRFHRDGRKFRQTKFYQSELLKRLMAQQG